MEEVIVSLDDDQDKITADADAMGLALVCATELLKRTLEMAKAEGYDDEKLINLRRYFVKRINAELTAIIERKWQ